MDSADPRIALKRAIADADNPFNVVTSELSELKQSLSMPPRLGQMTGAHNVASMRGVFEATVGAVGHEASRFGLVLTSLPPNMGAIRACCYSMLEAVQNLVSSVQLLTHTIENGGVLDASATRLCDGRRQQVVVLAGRASGQASGSGDADGGAAAESLKASTFVGYYRGYAQSLISGVSEVTKAGAYHLSLVLREGQGQGQGQGQGGGQGNGRNGATNGAGNGRASGRNANGFDTSSVGPGSNNPARAKQGFLRTAGMVHKIVEAAKTQLPASPLAAVRRRLLVLAKTVKDSAADIRSDHPDSSGASAAGAGASGAGGAGAGAGAQEATGQADNGAAGTAASTAAGARPEPSTAALPTIDSGVACLRAVMKLVKVATDSCEGAVSGGCSGAAATSASADSDATASTSTTTSPQTPCLDALATSALLLQEGVIDLAAAVNELGDKDEDDEDEVDGKDEREGQEGDAGGAGGLTGSMSGLSLDHNQPGSTPGPSPGRAQLPPALAGQITALREAIPAVQAGCDRLSADVSALLPCMEPSVAGALESALTSAGAEVRSSLRALQTSLEGYQAILVR